MQCAWADPHLASRQIDKDKRHRLLNPAAGADSALSAHSVLKRESAALLTGALKSSEKVPFGNPHRIGFELTNLLALNDLRFCARAPKFVNGFCTGRRIRLQAAVATTNSMAAPETMTWTVDRGTTT